MRFPPVGPAIHCAALAAALLGGAARADAQYDESFRRFQVKEHTNAVTAVAISPDGKTLATAGKDKSIRFFDLATGNARTSSIMNPRYGRSATAATARASPFPTAIRSSPSWTRKR